MGPAPRGCAAALAAAVGAVDAEATRPAWPIVAAGFTTRVDGPADATRVVNLTRHVVANIRPAPCLRVGQSPTVGLQASNGQFVGAHYAGGGPVTADREALEPWAGFHFEDENGGCVDAGDVVSLRTQHGFYLRDRGRRWWRRRRDRHHRRSLQPSGP